MSAKKLKDPVLLDAPMPIETPRLVIRPLQTGDGAALHAAKLETWGQLSTVFQWAAGTPDIDMDEVYARRAQADYILRKDFNLVGLDRKTGKPVLYAGTHATNLSVGEYQIGYWVRQSEQGRGLAKEAANALVRYTFNQLGANRLVMCHAEGNEASRKIITSLGFGFEGKRRNSLLIAGGKVKDALWYSRIDAKKMPALKVSW